MRIISKYILKEMGGPFLGSLFILTIILATGNIIQTADMILNKGVDIVQVTKAFLYFMPYVLVFTIPISVLSAILLGFGRLSVDNEITALRTTGISVYRIILPVITCGLLMSLLNVPLNDKVLPESEFKARKLIKTIGLKHPAALLEPGIFIRGFKNYIIFLNNVKGNHLYGIRIYEPRQGKPTRTIIAKRGEIIPVPEENMIKLKLEDGMADEITPDKPDEFYKLSFKEYYMILNLEGTIDSSKIQKKPREKNDKELLKDIRELGRNNISTIPLQIELHKKFALAFSNFVFAIIGIPLAVSTHRREKFIGFGMAIILFLVYWGIMLTGIAFALRNMIPVWSGVWAADIILTIAGVFMLRRLSLR